MLAKGVLLYCALAAELGAPRYYAIDFGLVAGLRADALPSFVTVSGYAPNGQRFLKVGIEVQNDGADRLLISGCRLVRVQPGLRGFPRAEYRPTLSGFPSLDAARKDR